VFEEIRSGKAPFQNVFRPHKKGKESVLKILEVSFRKTPFSKISPAQCAQSEHMQK